jgi:mRNA interferase MazF
MMRGDIYWTDFAPRSGSEQTGRRPAIVMTDDVYNLNARWMSIIVVPMSTSPKQARRGPTAVEIPGAEAGLPRTGVAVCHQVTTVDRSKLLKRMGSLPERLLASVSEGVKAAMDLP